MQTTVRAPIAPYPREESQLLTKIASSAPAVASRRRRWAAYLTGAEPVEAPLATRFVPLLAAGAGDEERGEEVAWPATLYPNGFRRQVLDHCGIAAEDGSSTDGGQGRLRAALRLNSMSLYRTTVQAFGRYAQSVRSGAHLTYEVTRAAYQVDPQRALPAFAALTSPDCPSLPIRLNAASRLVAHYARRGSDLDTCGQWVGVSTTLAAEVGEPSDYATRLAVSRVYRAAALYAARRRDGAAVTASLHASMTTSRQAADLAAGTDMQCLELAQNDRLIYEAALKAFVASGGRLDPFGAGASADRLAGLDPWDPYTRLTVGDARWILGDDEQALASYGVSASMGSLAGAVAAHHAAVVCARTGRRAEAEVWLARAVELDPAATVAELSGV